MGFDADLLPSERVLAQIGHTASAALLSIAAPLGLLPLLPPLPPCREPVTLTRSPRSSAQSSRLVSAFFTLGTSNKCTRIVGAKKRMKPFKVRITAALAG